MQFIDLKAQYVQLKARIDSRIRSVMGHGQYILGPEVRELEGRLARYAGVKHAITCANGTDALQLAMMALGIGPGHAVFCPTFTFFASAEAIAVVGATPIFVDSDQRSYNICPVDLERAICEVRQDGQLDAKAILAVDLFRLPADYVAIRSVATANSLAIVEDSAQAFGGSLHGQAACSFGDISTTSFFPAKPLGCYGDGGAVFTDDDRLADLLTSLRVHGKGFDKYDNQRVGLNSRLDTIQAAILLEKLDVFPEELEARQKVAAKYDAMLSGFTSCPVVPDVASSAWAQYTIVDARRDEIKSALDADGIPSMIYYRSCVHQQAAFRENASRLRPLRVAEGLARSVLSLPMHPYLETSDIERVVAPVKRLGATDNV